MPVGQRDRVYTGVRVRADYKPNRESMAKLALSPELAAIVMGIAESRAKPFVQEYADSFRDDGDYQAGLRVELTTVILPVIGPNARYPMKRVAARLLAEAEHSIIVEVGARGSDGHHPLRHALDYIHATQHHF